MNVIMYTIYPPEIIFEGYDSYTPNYLELQYEDSIVQVELLSATTGKIVRLISPVAGNYLNPRLQPGTIILLAPQF